MAAQLHSSPADLSDRLAVPEFQPDQSRAYQIAMGRYEARMLIRPGMVAPFTIIAPVQRFVWTWANPSEQVQRLAQDVFRLSGNDCLSHFCRQIYCVKVAWPVFRCSDNRQREMSAPDADTMIFGGATYKRITIAP